MTEGKRNIHSAPDSERIRYPVSGRHPGCSEGSSWWNNQRDEGRTFRIRKIRAF